MKLLPFGLDIGATGVGIVQYELLRGHPRVIFTEYLAYETDGEPFEVRQLAAIQSLVAQLPNPQNDCIVALPAGDIAVTTFDVPRRAREKDVLSAAESEAARLIAEIPSSRRIIAVSPTSDPQQRMLAVGDQQNLDSLLAVVTRAGLKAVACDVPIAVWQRILGGTAETRTTDALLDLSGQQAVLYIFPSNADKVVGRTIVMPSGIHIDTLIKQVRAALIEARRDDFANVTSLTVYSPDDELRGATIDALTLADESLTVSGLLLNSIQSPQWAFALGLGTWSVATGGYLRANLIKPSVAPWDVVRRQLVSADFARMMVGFGAGIGMAAVYSIGLSMYQKGIEQQANVYQQRITAISAQRATAERYVAEDSSLEAIDRDAHWLYHNGQILALQLAYIGNAVPPGRRIWLESLTSTPTGWALQGHGVSIDDEANYINRLAKVQPGSDTRYQEITSTNNNSFTASISSAPATPGPPPAHAPLRIHNMQELDKP